MITILAICGCGVGSSVILKMNADKAIKELGLDAKVEVSDITTGKGASRTADLIIIGKELAYLTRDIEKPVIELNNFVNKKEIKEKLQKYFEAQRIL